MRCRCIYLVLVALELNLLKKNCIQKGQNYCVVADFDGTLDHGC
jgi:hypothetical protein